jgi:hypothetical protein
MNVIGVEIELAPTNLSLRPRTQAPECLDWAPKALHNLIATDALPVMSESRLELVVISGGGTDLSVP